MNIADLFGKPGTGIHKYRFFGIAIVDTLLTILLAIIVSLIFKKPFFIVLFVCFLVGIVSHKVFGVKTKIDTMIFGKN